MKYFKMTHYLLLSLLLTLSACSVKNSEMATEALVDANCAITANSYTHIYNRHCVAGKGSRFVNAYCTQAGMQNFCRMVQSSPNKVRTIQPDGRVRYDANLGSVVGTSGEKCGRLLIASTLNGTVVTQFPEFGGGAPGPCN